MSECLPSENAVRPFSNGSEYEVWEDACCGRCSKGIFNPEELPYKCDIQLELASAFWKDGTVSIPIAERMGLKEEEHWCPFNRPCTEFVMAEE